MAKIGGYLLGVAAVAFAGCSDPGGDTRSTYVLPSDYSEGALDSPIDAVLQAGGGYLAQEQAIYDYRKLCMEDAGFEFNDPRPSVDNLNESRFPRVASLSVDDARADGFRSLAIRSEGESQSQTSGSKEYFTTLQRCTEAAPAYQATQGEGYLALQNRFYEKLYAFEERYKADDDLAMINKEWRSCTSDAGYDSDNPTLFLEEHFPLDLASPVTEAELAAATAYASCLESLTYVEREAGVRWTRESEFVAENEQLISEMLAARYDK